MCVCVHTSTRVYIYTHMYIQMYLYTHIHTLCVHMCIHTVCVCIYVCTHSLLFLYTCVFAFKTIQFLLPLLGFKMISHQLYKGRPTQLLAHTGSQTGWNQTLSFLKKEKEIEDFFCCTFILRPQQPRRFNKRFLCQAWKNVWVKPF